MRLTPKITLFAFVAFFLSGCVSLNKITYLQDDDQKALKVPTPPDYRLKKGDVISVRIFGVNQNETTIFNVESNPNSTNPNTTSANLYLSGFEVSAKGEIEIPNIGRITVANKTLDQAKLDIQRMADEYLIGSTVIVKHLNFDITILGEVNNPGTFPIYKKNINILEALGLAGDLTDYANRKEILLIRNSSQTYTCDLSNIKLLESEVFYLQPGDVLYAQPTGSVVFRKSKLQLLFSGITSFSVMFSIILNVMGVL